MKKINLARKPFTPETMPMMGKEEPSYPTVHIDHPDSLGIPDQGMATVKHKVISRHIDKKNGRHTATLELHSFQPHPKKKAGDEAEKAMKNIMDESE